MRMGVAEAMLRRVQADATERRNLIQNLHAFHRPLIDDPVRLHRQYPVRLRGDDPALSRGLLHFHREAKVRALPGTWRRAPTRCQGDARPEDFRRNPSLGIDLWHGVGERAHRAFGLSLRRLATKNRLRERDGNGER